MKWMALVLAFTAGSAFAEPLYIYTGAISQHFAQHDPGSEPYNADHRLVAVQYSNFQIGYYYNSYNIDTLFIGIVKEWQVPHHTSLIVSAAANYGYTHCIKGTNGNSDQERKKVCGQIMAGAYYNEYAAQPGIIINPSFVALSLRWEFDL